MSDSSVFEELPLEGLDEEVFSSLGTMYDGEAVKGVHKVLKNSTPFKMVAIVSFFILFLFYVLCPS